MSNMLAVFTKLGVNAGEYRTSPRLAEQYD